MSRPLHIAMVVARFPPYVGGSELQALTLARKIVEKGGSVTLLTQRLGKTAPARETMDGVEIRRLALWAARTRWETPAFIASAVWALGTIKPDVCHAHMLASPAVACALARLLWGIPALAKGSGVEAIGEAGRSRGSLPRLLKFRLLKKGLDAVVCTIPLMRDEYAALGFPRERIRLIPNGVDTGRYRPASGAERDKAKSALGIPPHAPVALYTGRISPEKGVDVLIDAWSRAPLPTNAILLIVGEGPKRTVLQEKAVPGVRWAGERSEVASCLRAADVFVLPSRGEALSNSLLEALASGLPCVASRVGGTSQVIVDGENGILVVPEDPEALGRALVRLLADADLRARLGRSARRLAEARFDLDAVAEDVLRLYGELVSRSAS